MTKYVSKVRKIKEAKGLGNPNPVHHCPNCLEYLCADKNTHISDYNFCLYCGIEIKGKKLPYDLL